MLCCCVWQWLLHGRAQVPGLATLSAAVEDSSYLQRLELALNGVCQELVRQQTTGLVQVGDELTVPGSRVALLLVRRVHLAELKRFQSQFIKMAKLRPALSEADMASSFVQHLQNALEY